MSARKTIVPSIPAVTGTPQAVDAVLKAAKEAIEVGLGRRGDPLDRFVTVRELSESGIASVGVGAGGAAISAPSSGGGSNAPPGAPVFQPGDPNFGGDDFTVPPAPIGVMAVPVGPDGIMVTWQPPQYKNHSYSEVFRVSGVITDAGAAPGGAGHSLNLLPNGPIPLSGYTPPGGANWILLNRAAGMIYVDSPVTPIAQPGADALTSALAPLPYFYYVRFVSTAGVAGPYAPGGGYPCAPNINPTAVLAAMILGIQGSTIYKNLIGQYLTPTQFALGVLASASPGGLNPIITQINTTIGGIFDPAGSSSLFGRINTLDGNAKIDEASISDITQWQSRLDTAVAGSAQVTSYQVGLYFYQINATYAGFLFSTGAPFGSLAVGTKVKINANGNTTFAVVDGKTITITEIVTDPFSITEVHTARKCDDGTVLPTNQAFGTPPLIQLQVTSGVGQPFASFIGNVYTDVWTGVTAKSAMAKTLNGLYAQINTGTNSIVSSVNQLTTASAKVTGELSGMWSVQMAQVGQGGIYAAAGFGLSLDTFPTPNLDGTYSSNKWSQRSTFAINANQFAIMGNGNIGAVIKSITPGASIGGFPAASIRLTTPNHGFIVPSPIPLDSAGNKVYPQALFVIQNNLNSSGQVITGAGANPLSGIQFEGLAVNIVATNADTLTVVLTTGGTFPSTASDISSFQNALVAPPNIPFIVDTTKNVVGIRGSLIVDGLIRAQTGDFNTLTSQTAFIQNLYANVFNANLVIGQKIVAGAVGQPVTDASGKLITGAGSSITPTALGKVGNYVIEMNAPGTIIGGQPVGDGRYPLRYYKPSNVGTSLDPFGQGNFFLDYNGNMGVGGNLSVGKNAVIATTSTNLLSIGGGGVENDGTQYVLWIGPNTPGGYGIQGEKRSETNGMIWAKDNGRVGINASVFLGDFPLIPPTADGYITVPPSRSGLPATVYVSGIVNIAGATDGSGSSTETQLGAMLMLVSTGVAGNAGPLRAGIGYGTSVATINQHVYCEQGAPADSPPTGFTGSILISGTQFDSKGTDIKNIALQGAASVPAGAYKALMYVWRKPNDVNGALACFNCNFYAGLAR